MEMADVAVLQVPKDDDDPYIVELATRNEKPTCELTAEMSYPRPTVVLARLVHRMGKHCQVLRLRLATWPCLRSTTE